jgi:hypothetical protein
MTSLFGDNYSFTVHTYDYLGMAPRPYSSFDEMAVDIGKQEYMGEYIIPTHVWREGNRAKR